MYSDNLYEVFVKKNRLRVFASIFPICLHMTEHPFTKDSQVNIIEFRDKNNN